MFAPDAALADAEGKKIIRSFVGEPFDIGKRKDLFAAQIVAPDECAFYGVEACVFVDHVVSVVEIIGYVELEMVIKIVVIFELR